MSRYYRTAAAEVKTPQRCPHCSKVIWGSNKKYEKIVQLLMYNKLTFGTTTKYKDIKDHVNSEDNILPYMLQYLMHLNLIAKTKRGHYTSTDLNPYE